MITRNPQCLGIPVHINANLNPNLNANPNPNLNLDYSYRFAVYRKTKENIKKQEKTIHNSGFLLFCLVLWGGS